MEKIHPPYTWFGGKRKVADLVWSAIGDVDNYVEPFFGGGAVYLLRPHTPRVETINDYDGFVCNFWRAVHADPVELAKEINWPVNEIALEARHRYLCRMPEKQEFLERMKHDCDYYDIKRAAWWAWGINAWIGGGWCGGEYYEGEPGKSKGGGICDGANKMPYLGGAGRGVHRQLPHLGDAGRGEVERREAVLVEWMKQLKDRLRNTRVCCGDWSRVCTNGATSRFKTIGVFLDPPYSAEAGRDNNIYRVEDLSVAHDVRQWCIDRTDDHRFRIVLAGYDNEHMELESLGWRVVAWKANGGYGNPGEGKGKDNASRERLWFSPSCQQEKLLF